MKRARERVRDDVALVSEVASTVSSALGLDTANRTLGRNIVIAALDAQIEAESKTLQNSVGGSSSFVEDSDTSGITGNRVTTGGAGTDGEDTSGHAAFVTKARTYGSLGDGILSDVFRKVSSRLRGALVQLQAMEDEEGLLGADNDGEGNEIDDGVLNFAKGERLGGYGIGGVLKGGLVKKPTFQVGDELPFIA